jgi:hypothetical protein
VLFVHFLSHSFLFTFSFLPLRNFNSDSSEC